MLGRMFSGPTVYGIGTGNTKKCNGCWDGCGWEAPDNGTRRRREKRQWLRDMMNNIERSN